MQDNAPRLRKIIKKLRDEKLRIAFAESMTCGLIASRLGAVKGASDFFTGSVICYHPDVKRKLFSVPASLIKKYSPESSQVTKLLATNLSRILDADIYGAVTGLATPDPAARHPAGTVFIYVKRKNKFLNEKKHFKGSPYAIRKKAFLAMMRLVEKLV